MFRDLEYLLNVQDMQLLKLYRLHPMTSLRDFTGTVDVCSSWQVPVYFSKYALNNYMYYTYYRVSQKFPPYNKS